MSRPIAETPATSGPGDGVTEQPPRAAGLGGAWRAFLVRRAVGLVINLALLVVVTFLIVQLIPGDPATAIAGENATLAQVELVRQQLGLDQPLPAQLWNYVVAVVQGDFGDSFKYRIPAMDVVMAAAPNTLALTIPAVVLLLVLGLALGMVVGVLTRNGRRRALDLGFNGVTALISSVPTYVQATAFVVVFAVILRVLPPAYSPAYSLGTAAILPIASLTLGGLCSVARIVRRETAVILEQDYMRSARGWRLPALTIYARHMLPNLLTTALTLSGIILTALLGSALITEAVFAWPGLGSVIVQAIAIDKDYPVIRAAVFVIGVISLLTTLVIDIVLGLIDPRTLGEQRG
ncbi:MULTISPECIES: ABC transporter permease [Microbacterium]|jgi:ABC-type dipeptide/oligopeptide/nickel transport system permease component|uniref:ABC transporter permease n=1 Tax=Microbacterium TaxID=33882 RepID=UPI001D17031B|nr:ABC transporter permease [Microbacterium testaceum]MCC4248669.1 ABC transporter permease [Microbacterium testaceum]